jgi:Ca2+-transporting ATPase
LGPRQRSAGGSEVTKQAGKLILTADNFSTLVHAVVLGRAIYRRISTYVNCS